jgi:hypothetical protein
MTNIYGINVNKHKNTCNPEVASGVNRLIKRIIENECVDKTLEVLI